MQHFNQLKNKIVLPVICKNVTYCLTTSGTKKILIIFNCIALICNNLSIEKYKMIYYFKIMLIHFIFIYNK